MIWCLYSELCDLIRLVVTITMQGLEPLSLSLKGRTLTATLTLLIFYFAVSISGKTQPDMLLLSSLLILSDLFQWRQETLTCFLFLNKLNSNKSKRIKKDTYFIEYTKYYAD